MNRADLQRLSRLRLQEARTLMSSGQYSGAYYLAGYAVECGLKACIARETQRFDFPDKERALKSFTHKPGELLKLADLGGAFEAASRLNPKLASSWNLVLTWSEQSRYEVWTESEAGAMIEAVGRRQVGVLPWIKLHW